MKLIIYCLCFLLVFGPTVHAGTTYYLTDQITASGTSGNGLSRQARRVVMTPQHRFTVLFDNRTSGSSMMMYSKQNWANAFDSLLDIDGVAGAGSLDAVYYSMIHNLGETLFVDIIDEAGPQTTSRYTNFTFVARDTVFTLTPSTGRMVGSWYVAGDSMIVVTDEDWATDSTGMYISNGPISASTVWTRIGKTTRIANAGQFIPVYDGVGQGRYALKWNQNTDDVVIFDRLNIATTVSTALTGVADATLLGLGYTASQIIHIKADTFLVVYQSGLTGTKTCLARPFHITWSGTTPTGVGYNATAQTIVASGSVPDSMRLCPTASFVYDRADSGWVWYRLGTTRNPDGVYRAFTSDGGRTFSAGVKDIDTSEVETVAEKFWQLQAPMDIVSSSGTIYMALAFTDSVTVSGTSRGYAWTDTLYNPAAAPAGGVNVLNLNAKDNPAALNRKDGPRALNKK